MGAIPGAGRAPPGEQERHRGALAPPTVGDHAEGGNAFQEGSVAGKVASSRHKGGAARPAISTHRPA
jgi:hypothetical protein